MEKAAKAKRSSITAVAAPERRVTMKDVAEQAGVSVMTVSCALRNSPKVKPETRDKIRQIASRLGYAPDPELSKLMAHLRQPTRLAFSHTLAFINSWPDREEHKKGYCGRIFEGARLRAAAQGFDLEAFWLGERGMSERRLSRILRNRGIRGILLPPWHNPQGLPDFEWSAFSSVAATLSLTKPNLHRVAPNVFKNTLLALEELFSLGYRRIGYIDTSDSSQRSEGFARGAYEFFRATRLKDAPLPVLTTLDGPDPALAEWFDIHRPDAIVSTHASPRVRLLKTHGAAMGSCGYIVMDSAQDPSLTAIDVVPENIGSAAVDLLIAQIMRNETGVPENPKLVLMDGRIRQGKSTVRVRPGNSRAE
jgi:LacI family transcriptional regulator